MSVELIVMIIGFSFAAYSVVGNDVIQTLGTFLTSNEKRPWYILWLFAATILTSVLVYGWWQNTGDMAYGRLEKFPLPQPLAWYYALPPIILVLITRFGIPVSTTFMILTIFGKASTMQAVIIKSVTGYAVAFASAFIVYLIISKTIERHFMRVPGERDPYFKFWMAAQWLSTGFLWSQWLIQDLANIYVYLPRDLGTVPMIMSLVLLLGLLAYIFYNRGGKIQGIVKSKTNTADIRAATIVDLIYGIVLYIFKEMSNLPMSTTWVFIGLLSGREYAINLLLNRKQLGLVNRMALMDLGKTVLGLVVSVLLVMIINFFATGSFSLG